MSTLLEGPELALAMLAPAVVPLTGLLALTLAVSTDWPDLPPAAVAVLTDMWAPAVVPVAVLPEVAAVRLLVLCLLKAAAFCAAALTGLVAGFGSATFAVGTAEPLLAASGLLVEILLLCGLGTAAWSLDSCVCLSGVCKACGGVARRAGV